LDENQGGQNRFPSKGCAGCTLSALSDLMVLAEEWIKDYTSQVSIFPDQNPNRLLHLNYSSFIGVKYHFFHKQIPAIQDMLKLDESKKTVDGEILNHITQKIATVKAQPTEKIMELIAKLE
jgi:hypothetical protein